MQRLIKSLKKTQLGIYLGQDALSIVEFAGKEIRRHCRQSLSSFGASLDEISEDDIKFAAVIQKAIRENDFSSRDAHIALPAFDVLVRFFNIPVVSKKDMDSTVNFEARKYIPFRIEELIFKFISQRKDAKSLEIIFAAIKKKIIDKYIKVFNQVGFNILSLEPSSLSFLRLAYIKTKLNREGKRGALIVDIDSNLSNGDIIILDSGLPCFIRDISLTSSMPIGGSEETQAVLSKLVNEIRISIDYFRHRQNRRENNILNIYLFSDSNQVISWAEMITQELGIKCASFEAGKLLNIEGAHCDLLKAAGASLRQIVRFPIDLNLLRKEPQIKKAQPQFEAISKTFISKTTFKKYAISVAVLTSMVFLIWFWGNIKVKRVEKQVSDLVTLKGKSIFALKGANLELNDLQKIKESLKGELSQIKSTISQKVYLTEKIERLSKLLPEGVWLERLNFRKDLNSLEINLEGFAYLEMSQDELPAINQLLNNLRSDTLFKEGFKEIVLSSVSQSSVDDFVVRQFQIQCR
ncbi:MAG: pilus assembly protein PilM [Candidatus Omnitrophota bacterium]